MSRTAKQLGIADRSVVDLEIILSKLLDGFRLGHTNRSDGRVTGKM